jgi:hypothetical protein
MGIRSKATRLAERIVGMSDEVKGDGVVAARGDVMRMRDEIKGDRIMVMRDEII